MEDDEDNEIPSVRQRLGPRLHSPESKSPKR